MPEVTTTKERSALITGVEAQAILGISRATFQRLVAAGGLERVRIKGLGWDKYRRADVEKLVGPYE
jgi:Helix-turn-helix domain